MRFVGFPNGLHQTSEEMKGWFQWIESNRPVLNHYSIFENGNYCGESFYEIDEEHQSAALDIKLFGFARGRGIATAGLSFAIKEQCIDQIIGINHGEEGEKEDAR